MHERPIPMKAHEVRAILDGRKTQTRRLVKPQPIDALLLTHSGYSSWHNESGRPLPNAYGKPGDRLWVRETFLIRRHEPCLEHEREWQNLCGPMIHYLADGTEQRIQGNRRTGFGIYHGMIERNRPSIHMPRWASRITLEITAVRVERLQDISAADAVAEGVNVHPYHRRKPVSNRYGPVRAYRDLRESIHGPDAWDANPWVWVIEFKRIAQQDVPT